MITTIGWTFTFLADGSILPGFTYNQWWGCQKVRRGCRDCYAEKLSNRWVKGPTLWGPNAPRKIASEKYMKNPLKWNALAEQLGVRLKVFCLSMGDIWEDRRDLDAEREKLFRLVEATPMLNWLFLTKRYDFEKLLPERWLQIVTNKDTTAYGGPASYSGYDIPRNIWMGITVEENKTILEEYPVWQSQVKRLCFAKTFLSIEPLVGPLTSLEIIFDEHGRIPDWVITGGESGNTADPVHPAWIKDIMRYCEEFDVPFFHKQWGEWGPASEMPDVAIAGQWLSEDGGRKPADADFETIQGRNMVLIRKVGKSKSGRLIGGKEYNDSPDYMQQTGNTEEVKKYLEKLDKKNAR